MDTMSNLLLRVVDRRLSEGIENRIKLIRIISKLLEGMPYALIEFKPAYGHIFDNYIPKDIYSHWGYSDFDVMFGDLPHWITLDELEEYDIVTYSFGDQYRVYIRGQFTFHRNNDKINNIWRSCDYLTNMDRRLLKMVKEKRFSLESAEGCYSYAVLQRKDIKVKYASKALTDANNEEIYKNGIMLITGQTGQKSIIFTPRFHAPSSYLMSIRWFEDNQNYGHASPQSEIDTMRVIEPINAHEGCMQWVPRKYRHALCFQNIESTDNVFLIDGILFKQPFKELMGPEQARTTKALFHFQDGKRIFGSSHLLAFLGHSRKHGWILDQHGAYQLLSQKLQISTRNLRYRLDRGLDHNRYRSHILPGERICLKTSNIKDHMSPRCDYSLSWLDFDVYKLISDDWLSVDISDVTLVLTAQINTLFDFGKVLKAVAHNFMHWKDSPVILLIHLKGPPRQKSEIIDTIRSLSIQRSSYLIGIVGYRSDMNVNSKNLLSLAEVPCKTRWIVSGVDSTEGLVLSKESSFFARRVSNLYKGSSGHAFIVPKMNMTKIGMSDSDLDVYHNLSYSLFSEKYHLFQAVINGCCGPLSKYEQSISRQVDYIWRALNQEYIEESFPNIDNDDAREDQLAGHLARLQKDILCLFNGTNVEALLQFHSSPIIMVDKQGPFDNVGNFLMIQDSSRLPDKCTNGLRIAKLALMGYNIMPLPGALGVSIADATSCAHKDCSTCEINDEQRKMISIEKTFAAKTFLYSHIDEI